MGGWACCHRRQFPAGRLPRQTVHECGIAHGDTYGDRDSYGNCGSERNSYSYSYPDSNCNGYINANCDPDSYGHAYTVCCA